MNDPLKDWNDPYGCQDISLAQEVINELQVERDRLQIENQILRRGVKGDFDLDTWLDWVTEKEARRVIQ